MKLLIGIATYQRTKKLQRLLRSLYWTSYKDYRIEIVADNKDYNTRNEIQYLNADMVVKVQDSHKFVIGAWNRVVQENIDKDDWDGFIGLCDDVELKIDTLQKAVDQFKEHFPDGDGVVGFKQECPGHPEYTFKWFGQTLMGRKFIERYKDVNYQICCPDYKHFYQDEEMYEYASSLNKFKICGNAVLLHYHPGFVSEEVDETHNIIRSGSVSPKNYDIALNKKRKEAGLLWGKDFKLLGGKDD